MKTFRWTLILPVVVMVVAILTLGEWRGRGKAACWDVRHSALAANQTFLVNRCTGATWLLVKDNDIEVWLSIRKWEDPAHQELRRQQ